MDFRLDTSRTHGPDQRAHQAHHSELAAESHRRRADRAGHRGYCRRRRRPQHHGSQRRDLLPPASLKASTILHLQLSRAARPHHPARRLLEDLRHDRLAHGIRRDARGPGAAHRAADDQLQLLHRQLHPDGRHRALRGPTELRGRDVRGVQAAPRLLRRARQPHQGILAAGCPRERSTCSPTSPGRDGRSKTLADALLEEAGVAALSGTAFGAYGEGYLRFSIANSMENIAKALDRVEAWVAKNVS